MKKNIKIQFTIDTDYKKNEDFYNWISKCPVEAMEVTKKPVKIDFYKKKK